MITAISDSLMETHKERVRRLLVQEGLARRRSLGTRSSSTLCGVRGLTVFVTPSVQGKNMPVPMFVWKPTDGKPTDVSPIGPLSKSVDEIHKFPIHRRLHPQISQIGADGVRASDVGRVP